MLKVAFRTTRLAHLCSHTSPDKYLMHIGYTMEKYGICAYVTHEFAVFPEAKPREKTGK